MAATKPIQGFPFSSRLDPSDTRAITDATQLRDEAVSLRDAVARGRYFESELHSFRSIIKRAPRAVQESAAQLQDLAGVNRQYFDDVVKYGKRPQPAYMTCVLDAIIATANERLLDVEGAHVAKWIENPYTLDSARDLQRDLEEIVEFLRSSNSLARVPELEDVTRRHLIDLCKTVITLLGASRVETSLLRQCANALKKLGPLILSAAVSAAVGSAVNSLLDGASPVCSNDGRRSAA